MKLALAICSGTLFLACGTAAAQADLTHPAGQSQVQSTPSWYKNFTLSDNIPNADPTNVMTFQETARAFQWGGNGRWQMNLNMVTRPEESPLPREEMRAGASYQFTPRFSLGGSVSVGAQELNDVSTWEEQQVEAGVKLKTTFKF